MVTNASGMTILGYLEKIGKPAILMHRRLKSLA